MTKRVARMAVMPGMFVVVPIMIVIVKALSRLNDAAQDQADQSYQEAAFSYTFCIYHGRSCTDYFFRLTHDADARRRLISCNARV
jgi:hypothetical protein